MYLCIYVYIHIYVFINRFEDEATWPALRRSARRVRLAGIYLSIYLSICMYICTYIYIYIYIYVRIHIYICTYIYTYIYTYIDLFICRFEKVGTWPALRRAARRFRLAGHVPSHTVDTNPFIKVNFPHAIDLAPYVVKIGHVTPHNMWSTKPLKSTVWIVTLIPGSQRPRDNLVSLQRDATGCNHNGVDDVKC